MYDAPITVYYVSGYKFSGKERDSESGLDSMGRRYYGSNFGRFTSPDPFIPFNLKKDKFQQWIANPQHWNKYAYALNNPRVAHTSLPLACVGQFGGSSGK